MRILVTGISGFIGRHLALELMAHGHVVLGVDKDPAPTFESSGPLEFWREDLLEPGAAEDVIDATRPEVVVHLAAQVGRLFGEDDVRRTVNSNGLLTTLVARACGEYGARMVYASTSEVYGDQRDTVCDELAGPFSLPHNLYGLSKRWGEEVCKLYALPGLTTLRFSMPYGPGVVPGRGRAALPNILWQAHTGQRIPIHRGSERSWCWIGDTVAATRMIIERTRAGAYNVGRDDAAVSMLEVAKRACAIMGASEELIDEIDPPKAQTVVKRLGTYRLRNVGWEPTVDLAEGMLRVAEWVRRFDAEGRLIA